jgi:hypothetical protein
VQKNEKNCERCGAPKASIRVIEEVARGVWFGTELSLCGKCDQALKELDRSAWEWFRGHSRPQ